MKRARGIVIAVWLAGVLAGCSGSPAKPAATKTVAAPPASRSTAPSPSVTAFVPKSELEGSDIDAGVWLPAESYPLHDVYQWTTERGLPNATLTDLTYACDNTQSFGRLGSTAGATRLAEPGKPHGADHADFNGYQVIYYFPNPAVAATAFDTLTHAIQACAKDAFTGPRDWATVQTAAADHAVSFVEHAEVYEGTGFQEYHDYFVQRGRLVTLVRMQASSQSNDAGADQDYLAKVSDSAVLADTAGHLELFGN